MADQEAGWDTLLWAWQGWRKESGAKMPDMYEQFADLLNAAARTNSAYTCVGHIYIFVGHVIHTRI